MATKMRNGQQEAREMLEKFAPRGSVVYCIVRSVAASGMSRVIDFYAFGADGETYLTGYVSRIITGTRTKEGGLRVAGGGMDMCFASVYALAQELYGDGYALTHRTL